LQSICADFRQQCADKPLQINLEISQAVPQLILVDSQKLQQVLINLIGNAVKFTEQGEITIRITVESTQAKTQNPENLIPIAFTVEDTGVGIAPEELDQIFDVFAQAAAGRQMTGGTGLGLSISQSMVRLMGGEITVESNLGVGSTFRFVLPIQLATTAIAPFPDSSQSVSRLAPGQPTCRILVVDDQETNRRPLVDLLTQIGFEVEEAASGEVALGCWQQWHPT
jgi:signal transduction histidine kinase